MTWYFPVNYSFSEALRTQAINDSKAAAQREAICAQISCEDDFRKAIVSSATPVLSDDAYAELERSRQLRLPHRRDFLGRLNEFHQVYESCFPIEAERQPWSGFVKILVKGHFDGALQDKIQASHREFLLVLHDPLSRQPIGGLNFVVYAHQDSAPTAQSCFAFLASDYRGFKLARSMFEIRDRVAFNYLRETAPDSLIKHKGFMVFAEQNIPEKMDSVSYVLDSARAIDPIKRLSIWSRLAYTTLDFDYIQPPYRRNGSPCNILSLNSYVRRTTGSDRASLAMGEIERPTEIQTSLLRRHLRAYFLQCVCKDANADNTEPTTRTVLSRVDTIHGDTVPLVPQHERQAYLKTWEARVQSLQSLLGDTPLDPTVTIADLYERHKGDLGAANENDRVIDLPSPLRERATRTASNGAELMHLAL